MTPILETECPAWKKTRYRLAFMIFIGNIILMSLRFNLSVAMVDMVKPIGKSETIGRVSQVDLLKFRLFTKLII